MFLNVMCGCKLYENNFSTFYKHAEQKPNMVDEEKENIQEGVTILTLPQKINITQVMITERKSCFVNKSEICQEKAQNEVATFRRRSR
jgi:hypothetical protein